MHFGIIRLVKWRMQYDSVYIVVVVVFLGLRYFGIIFFVLSAHYTLNRVSEPSASISVTVRLLIQINLARRIGFRRVTSGIGAVE